jgi:Protein of unknown function (DUF2442)
VLVCRLAAASSKINLDWLIERNIMVDTALEDLAQGLSGATPQDLAQVEITPMGDGLHWETLDTDFTVAGLLNGVFGTKRWMAALQAQWLQQSA